MRKDTKTQKPKARRARAGAAVTRRVCYSVAMSLDGYIAGPHGEYDWIIMDPAIDLGALFKRFDTMLMGRRTFEVAKGQGDGGAFPGMQAIVCSRTLAAGDYPGVTITADAVAAVASLRSEKGRDIWLMGGGELFRELLEADLVDEVEVGVIPVLLGGGVPLLPSVSRRTGLRLARHELFPSGIVMLSYDVTRGDG